MEKNGIRKILKNYEIKINKPTMEDIDKYTLWVINDCDSIGEEIEWLTDLILSDRPKEDIKKEFADNIKELLKQI